MHSKRGKFLAIIAIALMITLAVMVASSGMQISQLPDKEDTTTQVPTNGKDTVTLWYTDDALTEYLNSVAVSYSAVCEDVRVVPVLVSGREYLEAISAASVSKTDMPDIYITTNDMLEKAHLAGLAEEIAPPDRVDLNSIFPEVAIGAITYNGEKIAYPLYFECAALLYNSTYVDNWSVATAEAEIDTEEGEAAQAEVDNADKSKLAVAEEISLDTDNNQANDGSNESNEVIADEVEVDPVRQERVEKRSAELLDEYFPTSIDRLLAFSDMYDAPEGVEGIFEWDVTDIFFNYFFIGDAIDVGGINGDDTESINLYNETAIRGLMAYQDLNRFFSINTEEISYGQVLNDFREGKILFTIATSDSVRQLKDAVNNDEMEYSYRYAKLPDIMEGTKARSMSVTDVVAINGYSLQKEQANAFAYYLCSQDAATLYERAGKVSALRDADYGDEDEHLDIFMQEYERSVPLPKMLETSNLWVQMEMLFAGIWDGEDANKGLRNLSEDMMLQVTGEEYKETPIVIEIETVEEEEIVEPDLTAGDSTEE